MLSFLNSEFILTSCVAVLSIVVTGIFLKKVDRGI
jgi:hypothetical protein